MFYSQFILAKKGPLGTIWIAAHLERKLRKNQVTETNISVSVDSILFPEVPIALRLSGHLLLGVVRIYSRKVNYLFHDCSEALVKIKQAFHAGAVDLPPEAATAPFHSITLPETFDLDEFEPLLDKELNLLHSNGAVDHHVSSREQITLQDPLEDNSYLGSSQFELDERFPDADAPQFGMDFDEDLLDKPTRETSPVAVTLEEEEEEDEMTLEEDVIPPTTMDDALDYDQMDRMDPMDMDDDEHHEHHEPGTPALGIDNMDLDYQQEDDGLEIDHLHRSPEDLERLEPNFQLDHGDLDNLQLGVNQPVHLEPATPGSTELEKHENEELRDEQGEEERVQHQEDEENVERQQVGAEVDKELEEETLERQEVDAEVGNQLDDEPLERQLDDEPLERQLDDEPLEKKLDEKELMTERQEMVGVEEKQAVNEDGQDDKYGEAKEDDKEEVPEYETVMSAPEATNQEPDVFDLEKDMDLEQQASAVGYQDKDQIIVDRDRVFEDETIPIIQEEEDPQSVMAEPMSPMRSPPLPVISSDDLPGDDDVLASLLGGETPALKVLPTPVEPVVAKPSRKQGQRKRKIVIDMATILPADVMKQQLMNTDDIRRVRRKAPCTRQELWSVQKDALSQHIFCEHSVPGLCSELRVLFERVYVVGEAKLPLAEATIENVNVSEEVPEPQLPPVLDDLNMDINEMADQPAEPPVVEEEVQVAADEHHHRDVEAVGAVDVALEGSPHIQAEGIPSEDLQNVPSPTPGVEREQPAPDGLPKEDAVDGFEAEVIPVDLNSENLEMTEPMGTLAVDDHPLIDVNQEIPPQESTEVREEVNVHELVDAYKAGDIETEAEGMIVPIAVSEMEGIGTPVAEVEAEVGPEVESKVAIEAEFGVGPQAGIEVQAESTVVGDDVHSEAVHDIHAEAVGHDGMDVGDVHAETVPLEAHREEEVGVFKVQEEEPINVIPEKEVETETAVATPAVEVVSSVGAQPDNEDLDFLADTRDTEFLGADDDDLAEEAEDFQDVNEYARKEAVVQDNSGWSARTRAVGHYLRITLEDKDAYMKKRKEQGTAKLGLERMLVGKSRKEAARMFFETLDHLIVNKTSEIFTDKLLNMAVPELFTFPSVLKTKDYIHVEQDAPYADIQISARPKLLKAKF